MGEGGGAGLVRSMSGGSCLICNLRTFVPAADLRVTVFRLLDLGTFGQNVRAETGVMMISRGGVKRSLGYSYVGAGVDERARVGECCRIRSWLGCV